MRFTLALLLMISGLVHAADWSTSDLQLLYGRQFHEPGNPNAVAKQTLTFNHASGYHWGDLFLFLDALHSDHQDAGAEELYGEAYLHLSLNKISGRDLRTGPIKDVRLTFGVNHGHKSTGAQPLVWLPGVSLALDLPGFAYFDLGLTSYLDRGRFNGAPTNCNADSWQITPAWKYPFRLGQLGLSFEGFVDTIGRHGACAAQTLAQPQLKLDIGALLGHPGQLHVGIEYQYWKNKFGVQGLDEQFPQLLVTWGF
jgi:nucleoside-specific outer membrane channel protein Tsx